jgi:S1-C subfamily serine protease
MTSRIDFVKELGSTATLEFDITGVIGIHDEHDVALLSVAERSADGRSLPEPLAVAASAPRDLAGRDVYVVGYPAWDTSRSEPDALQRIFMDVYNVKRLQPGQSVAYSTTFSALQHDCSTLGGNSGSPVVDLETHQVVGLHFSGRYGSANYAVPLWTLSGDDLLRQGDVNFQ